MKPILITFYFCLYFAIELDAQVFDDVYNTPPRPKVKDMTPNSVSRFGHYFSIGLGPGKGASVSLIGYTKSYTLALKSHLISNSTCGSSFSGISSHEIFYSNKYNAILVGEALREKYFLFSLSIGLGYSNLTYSKPIHNQDPEIYDENNYSIPLEIRLYFLAYNGVGIGINANKNFTKKYSSSLISISIVLGIWNKSKPCSSA